MAYVHVEQARLHSLQTQIANLTQQIVELQQERADTVERIQMHYGIPMEQTMYGGPQAWARVDGKCEWCAHQCGIWMATPRHMVTCTSCTMGARTGVPPPPEVGSVVCSTATCLRRAAYGFSACCKGCAERHGHSSRCPATEWFLGSFQMGGTAFPAAAAPTPNGMRMQPAIADTPAATGDSWTLPDTGHIEEF